MILFSRTFIRKRAISLATTATVAATSFAFAQDTSNAYHLRGAVPLQYVADRPDLADEQPFLSENDAAMNNMMADMVIKPSGDVDRDFVAMMVPHHQGAIDMARAVLRYGHNEQLRRLAQEIVVTRQKEIAAMRLAVGDRLPPAAASASDGTQGLEPLQLAGEATHLALGAVRSRKTVGSAGANRDGNDEVTSVSLFDQGLIQVLQASVAGLEPKRPYVLAQERNGGLEPLAAFTTNPAGAAIVNATGPIRQTVRGEDGIARRHFVIAEGSADKPGPVVQMQLK